MFELPDESYFISDIQNFFEYIIKKHGTLTDKTPVEIYVNRMQNIITIKFKSGYYLELLTLETMKLLGSIKRKITKDKNRENSPHLENIEVVLVHSKIVNNK